MQAGLNLEFARTEAIALAEAFAQAAEAGYRFVECDTLEQARRSSSLLERLFAGG